jgi:hypothetical protein
MSCSNILSCVYHSGMLQKWVYVNTRRSDTSSRSALCCRVVQSLETGCPYTLRVCATVDYVDKKFSLARQARVEDVVRMCSHLRRVSLYITCLCNSGLRGQKFNDTPRTCRRCCWDVQSPEEGCPPTLCVCAIVDYVGQKVWCATPSTCRGCCSDVQSPEEGCLSIADEGSCPLFAALQSVPHTGGTVSKQCTCIPLKPMNTDRYRHQCTETVHRTEFQQAVHVQPFQAHDTQITQ